MTTETAILVTALVCAGVYITYLHSRIRFVTAQAKAVGTLLMYTIDALEEQTEEDE